MAALLAVASCIRFSYVPLLRAAGSFLVVEQPLEPAAAIVVLGGETPARETEAAELYRAGWAPYLVLVNGANRASAERRRAALLDGGVPPRAILLAEGNPRGTMEELRLAAEAIRPEHRPVILVTSNFHARRVLLTWRQVTGKMSPGIVQLARQNSFDPGGWWHQWQSTGLLVHEYLGLLNLIIMRGRPP